MINKKWCSLYTRLKTAVETFTHAEKRFIYNIQTPSNRFVLFVSVLKHSPLKHQSHRYERRTNDYRVRGINRRTEREQMNVHAVFFSFCSVMMRNRK